MRVGWILLLVGFIGIAILTLVSLIFKDSFIFEFAKSIILLPILVFFVGISMETIHHCSDIWQVEKQEKVK